MVTMGALLVKGGPEDGKTIILSGRPKIIGRGPQADISVDDLGVSRAHALIRCDHDGVWIQDLGSRNGVFVNDEKVGDTARQLYNFDRISLGGLDTPIQWVFTLPMDTVEMRRMALD